MSRAAADAWFDQHKDPLRERIQSRRDAIQQKRYPQVLITHSDANIPADGGGTIPDQLARITTDNGDGWNKLNLTIGGLWKAAVEVNNYGSQRGEGYELALYVRELGKLYRSVPLQVGPEVFRVQTWIEITER